MRSIFTKKAKKFMPTKFLNIFFLLILIAIPSFAEKEKESNSQSNFATCETCKRNIFSRRTYLQVPQTKANKIDNRSASGAN